MSKEELNEKIIVLKNYCNVLKKKNQINKDTIERNQKLILMQRDEIERLKEEVEEWKHNATRINNENNKLHSIIKEVRELTEMLYKNETNIFYKGTYKKQLEILDKAGSDKE